MAVERVSLRKVAVRALVWFAGVYAAVVLLFLATWGFVLPATLELLVTGLVIGYPVFLANGYLAAWLRIRWQAEHGGPPPALLAGPLGPSPLTPFRFSGRRWQPSAAFATLGVIALLIFLTRPVPGGPPLSGTLWFAEWVAVVSFAMAAVAAVIGSRRLTFVIDEQGIRCQGLLRQSFDAPWDRVARVEVARPPLLGWLSYPAEPPRLYGLRSKEGTVLASFSPAASVGPKLIPALEESLRAFAALRGVGVTEVPWSEAAGRRPAKRAGS